MGTPDFSAIVATSIDAHPPVLELGLRFYNAQIQHCRATGEWPDDADLSAINAHGYDIAAKVERLPNTMANLRLRALAIGATADDTDDLANLDLGELSAHAEGLTGRLVRQVLACVMAEPIAPTVAAPPVEPTPFRLAHDRYLAAQQAFEPMSGDATVPAWVRAEREFLEAAEAVDATPVQSWTEFADAYTVACDDGNSVMLEQVQRKLLADVRRLQARDRTDPSGWGEPHLGWLTAYLAARTVVGTATEEEEETPGYKATASHHVKLERLILDEPAHSREAVLVKLYVAAKIGADDACTDKVQMAALVREAEVAFGLGAEALA